MATREYLEDQDAEEPDDYVISLITQVTVVSIYYRYKYIFMSRFFLVNYVFCPYGL